MMRYMPLATLAAILLAFVTIAIGGPWSRFGWALLPGALVGALILAIGLSSSPPRLRDVLPWVPRRWR